MKKLHLWVVLFLVFFSHLTVPKISHAQQLPPTSTFNAKGQAIGKVRVKFTKEMTSTLSLSPMGTFSTAKIGIAAFDATSQHFNAQNLKRLFPFDPRFEHKLRKHGLHLWYEVEFDSNYEPEKVIQAYAQLGEVELSEPILEKSIIGGKGKVKMLDLEDIKALNQETAPTNDPLLGNQWHYENDGTNGFLSEASIHLYEAWKTSKGASNIIVSVHDEGIDITHEDLRDNMWVNESELNGTEGVDNDGNGYIGDVYGFNFSNNSGNISPDEHGTHVAGTIAAVNNNGIGVAGVAGGSGNNDGVKIMSCQILGGAYNGTAQSFVYAANNGAVISQNSWGWTAPNIYEQAVLDAIDYFIAEAGDYEGSPMKGGIVIFASGNSSSDSPYYPGYYENVVAVSSNNAQLGKAWYSNFGDWVDITAPGGDVSVSSSYGVLSTLPNNTYGYLQGTSMACPHVSGVAALVIATMGGEGYTPDVLRNQLLFSTNNIDNSLGAFSGKMGSGLIDASLAVIENQGVAPAIVDNISNTGITDAFIRLEWASVIDEDDGQASKYALYVSEGDQVDFSQDPIFVSSSAGVGETVKFTLDNLKASTNYVLSIIASDRWGNSSEASEVYAFATNNGPEIIYPKPANSWSYVIDETLDISLGETSVETTLEIGNNNEALLDWDLEVLQKRFSVRTWSSINVGNIQNIGKHLIGAPITTNDVIKAETPEELEPFENQLLSYSVSEYASNVIGETDLKLSNSTAVAHVVEDVNGFHFTKAAVWLNELTVGKATIEVYQGSNLSTAEKVLSKEIEDTSSGIKTINFTEDEVRFFPTGSVLWVVTHVPAGNLYPIGINRATENPNKGYQWMSFDHGKSWEFLEVALGDATKAFCVDIIGDEEHQGDHITITPTEGEINGINTTTLAFSADVSQIKNGYVRSNIVVHSNDPLTPEARIPVEINVIGHQPNVVVPGIVDFGSVQIGREKAIEISIDNYGYGVFKGGLNFTMNGTEFAIENKPYRVDPRSSETATIVYKPTVGGNINDILTITDRNGVEVQVHLFGNGEEPAKIAVSPAEQTHAITLGEKTTGSVTITNEGNYPLEYVIPKYSESIPEGSHKYGYSWSIGVDETAWEEIDGMEDVQDFTEQFKANPFLDFVEVDLGFNFPFYDTLVNKMYVSHIGLIALDTKDPVNGSFGQLLGRSFTSNGYIAFLYEYFDFGIDSKILYKTFNDHVVVEYVKMKSKVENGRSGDPMTFQVALYYDGNIEMRYLDLSRSNRDSTNPFIGLESPDKQDGFYIYEFRVMPEKLFVNDYQNVVIKVNYPGSNIISNLSSTEGVVGIGQSQEISFDIATEGLVEGQNTQHIAIINNDPLQPSIPFTVNANIIDGGESIVTTSDKDIHLGRVVRTDVGKHKIAFINEGSAIVNIVSCDIAGGVDSPFSVDKSTFTLNPRLGNFVTLSFHAETIGKYNETITFTDDMGIEYVFTVSAEVAPMPNITVDNTPKVFNLNVGDQASFSLPISNVAGDTALRVAPQMSNWLSIDEEMSPLSTIPDFTYAWKDNYNVLEGAADPNAPSYNWIDITKTGTFLNVRDTELYWYELDLPFEFDYWNLPYSKLWVGYTGIITFTEPDAFATPFSLEIPNAEEKPHNFVAPLWGLVGEDIYDEDPRKGIWYYEDEDKFVITYERWIHNWGSQGGYVSAQTIFQKDGSIKMQYKTENQAGVDHFSKWFSLGLENIDGTQGVNNNFYRKYITDGLAVEYSPSKAYTVAIDDMKEFTVTVDATHLVEGTYNHDLVLRNHMPGMEDVTIPITVNVTGKSDIAWSTDVIDFGNIIYDPMMGDLVAEVTINNNGTAPYALQEDKLQYSDGFGDPRSGMGPFFWCLLEEDSDFGFPAQHNWNAPSLIFSKWWGTEDYQYLPVQVDINGDIPVRLAVSPSGVGVIEKTVTIIDNDGSEHILTFKANIIDPPVFKSDNQSEYHVVANTLDYTETHTFTIDNIEGASDLDYSINLNFERNIENVSTSQTPFSMGVPAGLGSVPVPFGIQSNTIKEEDYHATISYDTETEAARSIGYGGPSLTTMTAFKAPEGGFELSNVATWLSPQGNISNGEIKIQILSGTIENPFILGSQTVQVDFDALTATGQMVLFDLDESITFFDQENIFIQITYPDGLSYPQGVVNFDDRIANAFFIPNGNAWYDITQEGNFAKTGFMVRALAKDPISGKWLSINTQGGTLAAGEAKIVEAIFDASHTRGDHTVTAHMTISSNDPNQEENVNIDLSMAINQAPIFNNFVSEISVNEADIVTLEMEITDPENHALNVELSGIEAIGSGVYESGKLSISLAPAYETSGEYTLNIVATDEHGLTTSKDVSVKVNHTNRAPEGTVEMDTLEIMLGDVAYIDPTTIFSDPDNDELVYSVAASDNGVILAGVANDQYAVSSLTEGISEIALMATDPSEASTIVVLPVKVSVENDDTVTAIDNTQNISSLSNYPNPVEDKTSISFELNTSGHVSIKIYAINGIMLDEIEAGLMSAGKFDIKYNASTLQSGVYVYVLHLNGKPQQFNRLIKK